jgi:hypothetical protein
MNSPIRCLLPALAGWLALAALALPEGGHPRIVLVAAYLVCGPGYAVAGTQATRLATAVTSVAISCALLGVTAETYLLAGAFSAPHVLGSLAGLTTSAALIRAGLAAANRQARTPSPRTAAPHRRVPAPSSRDAVSILRAAPPSPRVVAPSPRAALPASRPVTSASRTAPPSPRAAGREPR